MTREDIEKAVQTHNFNQRFLDEIALVDFALDMVRRHNEECAREADYYAKNSVMAKNIAKYIRQAKP